jgi:hypothetical protein
MTNHIVDANKMVPPPHLLKKFSEQARVDSKKRGHSGYCKTFAKLCIDWALNSQPSVALAQPEPQGPMPEVDDILRLAAIIRRVDGNHDKGAAALAEAILSHPDSRWQHAQPEPQGPQGPTDAELITMWATTRYIDQPEGGLAYGRAVLTRWGTPANEPVPPEPGVADHVTDDEGTRWDRTTDAALWAKAFCLICPEMASREDVMIGWFANAIMAGCDHQAWKMDAELKPVPVSERLPGPEDCDAEGRCWWFSPPACGPHTIRPCWTFDSETLEGDTHWLPRRALPVPGVEGADG